MNTKKAGSIMNIYDFNVVNNKGEEVSLSDYRGKVLLVVNTATKCGLTPQYEGLEALYQMYKDDGLEILDFPCNQFMGQAPEDDEGIEEFCTLNYNTTFPRFAKIEVNGSKADPLYKWLKENRPEDEEDKAGKAFAKKVKLLKPFAKKGDIQWNFGKFLIDRDGEIIARYSPGTSVETLVPALQKALA